MNFVSFEDVEKKFKGKSVAIVGSAPSCLDNKPGFIDSHDLVVRINNFKTKGFEDRVGQRTDVFYSFFGTSIKKTHTDLNGVSLCMCKCPNDKPIDSEWHNLKGKLGTDFRYIYESRKDFWFCDTYIPTTEKFLEYFFLLNKHVPTTGFSCILDILSFDCHVYLTGFDFFTSLKHNVNEHWNRGHQDDPIRHVPQEELKWLKKNHRFKNVNLDRKLRELIR